MRREPGSAMPAGRDAASELVVAPVEEDPVAAPDRSAAVRSYFRPGAPHGLRAGGRGASLSLGHSGGADRTVGSAALPGLAADPGGTEWLFDFTDLLDASSGKTTSWSFAIDGRRRAARRPWILV